MELELCYFLTNDVIRLVIKLFVIVNPSLEKITSNTNPFAEDTYLFSNRSLILQRPSQLRRVISHRLSLLRREFRLPPTLHCHPLFRRSLLRVLLLLLFLLFSVLRSCFPFQPRQLLHAPQAREGEPRASNLTRRLYFNATVVAPVATTGGAEISGGWLRVLAAAIDGVRTELGRVVAHAFSVETRTLHLLFFFSL